jgi:N-acetylglucosamine kinase-like BadF-type ATPase
LDSFFVLGLDGGGTKVEAVLMDSSGKVVAKGAGGPANAVFVGRDVARKSVEDALIEAVASVSSDKLKAIGACTMIHSFVEGACHELGFSGPFFYYSEGYIAFRRAGLLARRGVAVIAGTGSSFAAYDGDKRVGSLGGWGIAVGDEGSGFDIGLKAIKAAGRSFDGRGPSTVLLDMLLQHTGAANFHSLLGMYCYPFPSQHKIAAFARIVTSAANEGDEVAQVILSDAGRGLGEDAAHLAGKLFQPEDEFDVALSGGVFNAGELVTAQLNDAVHRKFSNAKIHIPQMIAGEAVARLTLEEIVNQ